MDKYLQLNMEGAKMIAGPAERNKQPILSVLREHLRVVKEPALVLEVSSGTGQHMGLFAPNLPQFTFQPTEHDLKCLNSIKAHVKESGAQNVKEPKFLDASTPVSEWLGGSLEAGSLSGMININMIHISSSQAVEGLFRGAGVLLAAGGRLITYGAYSVNGVITPESNVRFNEMLLGMNPDWHLRDIERDLKPLAAKSGLTLELVIDMPANNKCLIWEKRSS